MNMAIDSTSTKLSDRLHGKKTLKVANFLDEFEKDDIRRKTNIVDLFSHFGISLSKKGKNWTGKCPWHDDTNPSLSVDREKGLYNCFGCGESGDVFTLTEKMKGFGFKESLAFLKEFSGSPVAPTQAGNDKEALNTASMSAKEADIEGHGKDEELAQGIIAGIQTLTSVCDFYQKKLYDTSTKFMPSMVEVLGDRPAVEYLNKRGFENLQNYDRFKIGFVDGSLLNIIGEKQKAELTDIGILNQYGKEHFLNYITFPIFDELGIVVGLYGRRISSSPSGRGDRGEGFPNHLYLKGKHKGIFNRKASKVYDEIILTECIIDCLSLIELGIENVQSIYGTNGFTDEHLQILKDDRVKTVILALDNDEAGKTASEKIKDRLLAEGFKVKSITTPSVTGVTSPPINGGEKAEAGLKDWNEYLVSGGSSERIKEAIAKAEEFHTIEDTAGLKVTEEQGGYIFTISGVSYRVSGVREFFVNNLRVNIRAVLRLGSGTEDEVKYFDNLDLYSARSRANYSVNLSKAFNIEPKRIEKDLIAILEYLELMRDRKLRGGEEVKEEMTAQEIELGLSLLKDEKLFERIVEDMEILGYVGEDLNKKLLYLAASSRILDDPISVLILSQSASGKSMLVDTVRKLIPPDEVIAVTSLSDQALNYVQSLMHKFLILGEAVHNDIIEHQIREMLSGKELSRLVTIKDEKTGKMSSREIKTPVIVSAVMSGTNHSINPENASRSFVVNADESKEQTQRIHEAQRGKHSLERHYTKSKLVPEIIRKHHAAQRLLKKIIVVNPFAQHLNFPLNLMRSRRDHDRLLDLIACVCFLRQYQKEIKRDASGSVTEIEYIECDITDYEIAYDIMINGVLSSTMTEIPRGTIDLYNLICELAGKTAKKKNLEPAEVSLTQRDIREYTKLGQSWIKQHLRILLDYEYLLVVKGGAERSKGFYRIRALEPIQKLDLSMIPTPEQMKILVLGGER